MEQHRNDWDEQLEGPEQQGIRNLVATLPDDEPSMAWRSQLNDRLRALPSQARRKWWELAWKPTVGLALAGSLAVLVFVKPSSAPTLESTPSVSVADAMIAAHREAVVRHELGTIPEETLRSDTGPVPSEWNEADLSTL